ncbi:MAG: tetratricopeptide repeat protein [Myxococcota bacterium]
MKPPGAVVFLLAFGLGLGCRDRPEPTPAPPASACPPGAPDVCLARGQAHLADAPDKAVAAFEQGCRAADAACCFALARLLAEGRGTGRDTPRAATLMSQSCNADLAAACVGLAGLERKVETPDEPEVQRLFERACTLGDATGCLEAGTRWAAGTGVAEASKTEALKRWEKACAGGSTRGCAALGLNLVLGLDTEKDPTRGAMLLLRACNASDALACKDLGGLHLAGLLPDSRPAQGVVLLENACNLGYGEGCNELAVAHAQQLGGLTRDPATSARLFSKACRRESPAGCGNFALALFAGDGVAADPARGRTLLARACGQGHSESCGYVEQLESTDN